LGTLAQLASVGSSIVFKDWIAIIAGGDSETLARKINLIFNKIQNLETSEDIE
jgi:hypothetical protein